MLVTCVVPATFVKRLPNGFQTPWTFGTLWVVVAQMSLVHWEHHVLAKLVILGLSLISPLRQYFNLHRAVSLRMGDTCRIYWRENMSKQPSPTPSASRVVLCPSISAYKYPKFHGIFAVTVTITMLAKNQPLTSIGPRYSIIYYSVTWVCKFRFFLSCSIVWNCKKWKWHVIITVEWLDNIYFWYSFTSVFLLKSKRFGFYHLFKRS